MGTQGNSLGKAGPHGLSEEVIYSDPEGQSLCREHTRAPDRGGSTRRNRTESVWGLQKQKGRQQLGQDKEEGGAKMMMGWSQEDKVGGGVEPRGLAA